MLYQLSTHTLNSTIFDEYFNIFFPFSLLMIASHTDIRSGAWKSSLYIKKFSNMCSSYAISHWIDQKVLPTAHTYLSHLYSSLFLCIFSVSIMFCFCNDKVSRLLVDYKFTGCIVHWERHLQKRNYTSNIICNIEF